MARDSGLGSNHHGPVIQAPYYIEYDITRTEAIFLGRVMMLTAMTSSVGIASFRAAPKIAGEEPAAVGEAYDHH